MWYVSEIQEEKSSDSFAFYSFDFRKIILCIILVGDVYVYVYLCIFPLLCTCEFHVKFKVKFAD